MTRFTKDLWKQAVEAAVLTTVAAISAAIVAIGTVVVLAQFPGPNEGNYTLVGEMARMVLFVWAAFVAVLVPAVLKGTVSGRRRKYIEKVRAHARKVGYWDGYADAVGEERRQFQVLRCG